MKLSLVSQRIQTGDVFLFRRGRSIYARAVRFWTQSPYSHVGIALWLVIDGFRRLAIIEALEGHGVRLYPLDRYVEAEARAGGLIDWLRITDRHVDRDKVAAYALQAWGRRYASAWQLLWSWGTFSARIRRWLGKPAETDPERFFCSELVAGALRAGGYHPDGLDDLEPALTDPGSVALFPCLHRVGALEP